MNEVGRRIAVIDCGTNTFHLMLATVYKNGFDIDYKIKQAVRLGAGGINHNVLLAEAQDRALTVLGGFKNTIDAESVDAVYAFATSAFRNADNGIAFKQKIYDELKITIDIISGDQEAELIFEGVRYALQLDTTPALVMDIGGGSVEFIIGNQYGILWKKSFEIGGQRLIEKFHHHDPILQEEIIMLERYFETELSTLMHALKQYKPSVLAGSSGSFDTLSEIYCSTKNIMVSDQMKELPLTIEAYQTIHKNLIQLNRKERLQIPRMIPMRVDMIVVASCLINFLIEIHTFARMKVSTYSLKEGYLVKLIDS